MGSLPLFSVGILLVTCFVIGCNARVMVFQVEIEPVQPTPTEKDGASTSGHGNLAIDVGAGNAGDGPAIDPEQPEAGEAGESPEVSVGEEPPKTAMDQDKKPEAEEMAKAFRTTKEEETPKKGPWKAFRQGGDSPTSVFNNNRCGGIFDKTIVARVDEVCTDCFELYRDAAVVVRCRSDCFVNDVFTQCLESLLRQDESDQFREWIDFIG